MRAIPVVFAFVIGCAACDGSPPDSGAGDVSDAGADTPSGAQDGASDTGTWGELEADVAAALQAKLDQAVADLGLPGAAMGVAYADGQRFWAGASGYSRVESSEEWAPDRSFRVGSVTKTFTAALIFLLVEQGRLALSDPLERWAPGYYDGRGLTIRHLLSNTSGIVSYNYVGSFDDSRRWTPAELVEWAVDNEPELRFEPGSAWEYSNTNFVLLGMVIEAVTGNSYEAELQTRLLDPLALTHTYLAASGGDNAAIVDCYSEEGVNLTGSADPSFGWSAGAMVSTPGDLARWGVALFGGGVLSEDSMEQMLTPTELADGTTVEDYGLGAFIERDGVDAIYGHTGGIEGYLTYLYYWAPDRIALVVMANRLETNLRDLAGYGWSVALDLDFPSRGERAPRPASGPPLTQLARAIEALASPITLGEL